MDFIFEISVKNPLRKDSLYYLGQILCWPVFLVKKKIGVRGYFLKKRKLCMHNFRKERKQPPVVIQHQPMFCNKFIYSLWQESPEDPMKMFSP